MLATSAVCTWTIKGALFSALLEDPFYFVNLWLMMLAAILYIHCPLLGYKWSESIDTSNRSVYFLIQFLAGMARLDSCGSELFVWLFYFSFVCLFCFVLFFPRQSFSVALGLVWELALVGWSRAHRDLPVSASRVLGLKVGATTAQPSS